MEKEEYLNFLKDQDRLNELILNVEARNYQAIDKLGYDFLAEEGFDVNGVMESPDALKRLQKAIKAKGLRLTYHNAVGKDGEMIYYFTLDKGKTVVSKSRQLVVRIDYECGSEARLTVSSSLESHDSGAS